VEAGRLFASAQSLPSSLGSEGLFQEGFFLLSVGRARDALQIFDRIRGIDPIAPDSAVGRQLCLEMLNDVKGAESEYRYSLELARNETQVLIHSLAAVRLMGQRDRQALRQALAGLTDGSPIGTLDVAMTRELDDPPAALSKLRQTYSDPHFVRDPLPLVVVAQWAAFFDDPKLSLEVLRQMPRAGAERFEGVLFQLWRTVERDVRRLPDFKDFARELGLVDYWRRSGNWGDFCRPTGQDDFACT